MFLYWLARICSFICRRMPLQFSYALARVCSDIVYLTWPRGRARAKENMARALGSHASTEEIERAARGAFRNFGKYLVDFLRSPLLQPEDIENGIVVEGWENLDQALAEGKGAILVGLHLGHWDLAAMAIALRCYRLSAIFESLSHVRLDNFVQRLRAAMGSKLLPTKGGIGAMVQALRQNELLALLIDCPGPTKGVTVKFCGKTVEVPPGAATLALRTGARIIPGAFVRLPDNTFRGFFNQYIPFQPSGDFGKDVQALTQCIMNSLEEFVRQYPDQWVMFKRMWVEEVVS